jgi:hypothetical protein
VQATTIFTGAYSASAVITVLDLLTATIGPVNPLAADAPPSYSYAQSLASLNVGASLAVADLGISTGLLNVSVASPYTPTPTGTATSSINNLGVDLDASILTLLDVSATTLSSTSSVSGVGGTLSAVGSSTIENLNVSGLLIGAPITLSGIISPPVDDTIFNVGGLAITLNYQNPLGNGVTSDGVLTIPLLISFNNFVLGAGILNGDIGLAASGAEIDTTSPMPEPSAWVGMLLGVGLIGAAARRRAKIGRAAA